MKYPGTFGTLFHSIAYVSTLSGFTRSQLLHPSSAAPSALAASPVLSYLTRPQLPHPPQVSPPRIYGVTDP